MWLIWCITAGSHWGLDAGLGFGIYLFGMVRQDYRCEIGRSMAFSEPPFGLVTRREGIWDFSAGLLDVSGT
jgi:hypothetical protein